MDNNNDRKSYGNDNGYKSQYQPFYKPNYKPQYPSYGKDDIDKSKDSKVNINKIKCINTNLNINGNNTGDISIGNKGTDKGYLGAYSSGGNGYDNKKDKGFDDCIINNNNNNTNIILLGDGNITDSGGNVTESITTLTVTKTVACKLIISGMPRQYPEGLGPEDFQITIIGNNTSPSEFPGSSGGTLITLGVGNYTISETFGLDDFLKLDWIQHFQETVQRLISLRAKVQ